MPEEMRPLLLLEESIRSIQELADDITQTVTETLSFVVSLALLFSSSQVPARQQPAAKQAIAVTPEVAVGPQLPLAVPHQ
jgi:hypothetical protein